MSGVVFVEGILPPAPSSSIAELSMKIDFGRAGAERGIIIFLEFSVFEKSEYKFFLTSLNFDLDIPQYRIDRERPTIEC